MSLALHVIPQICFLVSFSPMISRQLTSLTSSSFWLVRSLSSSSSSSTTPLKATEIFLQPLTNYFLSSLSSILASLNLCNIEFSLFIRWISLFFTSSKTFVLSWSLLARALSFSLLFLISTIYFKWKISSTLYRTFLINSCWYWIWTDAFGIKSGLGIVTLILSTWLLLLPLLPWLLFPEPPTLKVDFLFGDTPWFLCRPP